MKKRIIAAIAGVFLIGSLTGCSSQLSNEYITIKQYKGLEVPQVEATELTGDQVTNYVNYFLQADATRTEVTDRAAQTGDTVNIDYVGKVDGVEFEGGSAQEQTWSLVPVLLSVQTETTRDLRTRLSVITKESSLTLRYSSRIRIRIQRWPEKSQCLPLL